MSKIVEREVAFTVAQSDSGPIAMELMINKYK